MQHGMRSALTPIVTLLGLDIGVLPGRQRDPHRDRLQHSRNRRRARHRHRPVRLRADSGDRPLRCLLHRHLQPDRRHRLRLPRPQGALPVTGTAPLLKVQDLQCPSPRHRRGHPDRGRRDLVHGPSRRDPGRGRRVGVGQERRQHDHPRTHPGRERRDLRAAGLRRSRPQRLSSDDIRAVRGEEIAMIFQDPLTSLHPFYKVGRQMVEAVQATARPATRRQGRGRSSCSRWSASPTPSGASTSTRTSSRAACDSGR